MLVYNLAHTRTGDKGSAVNISVVAYDRGRYDHLACHLTSQMVMSQFKHIAEGPVTRYDLPKIRAFNFVILGALGGGVKTNMSVYLHGKSLSSLMLGIEVPDLADNQAEGQFR